MIQRMVITFNNGHTDWVDPVVEIKETDDSIIINNGYYDYEYKKAEISKHEIISIDDKITGVKE